MSKYYEESKITYQQIVMGQIKIIQNIAAKELRDSTRTVKNLIGEQTLESEDTRYSYLQSIETLGSLLSPYFNDDVETKFKNFVELYDIELIEALNDEDFKKEVEKIFGKKDIKSLITSDEGLRYQANLFLLNYKIKNARIMFRELIKLFKINEFLSEESFGEGNGSDNDSNMDAEDEDGAE